MGHSSIKTEIARGNYQKAIELAVKHFPLRNAVYDASIIGEGKIDEKGIIRIGKSAFFFGFDTEKGKNGTLSAANKFLGMATLGHLEGNKSTV